MLIMNKDDLFLTLFILCAAAFAAAAFALTGPFGSKGSVKAYFVSSEVLERGLKGKEREEFDPSVLRFEGTEVPFDPEAGTLYIPQSIEVPDWQGRLTLTGQGGKICIASDDQADGELRKDSIEKGRPFRLAVIFPDSYMECSIVFTGLPAICIDYGDGGIRGKEEHAGRITSIDPYRNEYRSFECSFHVRGNTSVLFDKKSYRVELHDKAGNGLKESLLGLREDDDWILNSLATDKTLAREKVCYGLWEELGRMEEHPVPAPAMEYAELFMNGSYMGIYGLMYPVDRKLMGMRTGDILYKIRTWKEEMDAPGELTDYNGLNEILNTNGFAYASIEYPKEDESLFDWGPLEAYQRFVFETGDLSDLAEEKIILDKENFIFHELFCEMVRAADNTWKNLYLAAYRNSAGEYILRETIWDLNYTFGDAFVWDPENGNTAFLRESTDSYKLRYDRDYGYSALLNADKDTEAEAAEKWNRWRKEGVGPGMIRAMFEEESDLLSASGAMSRNEERWPGSTSGDSAELFDWIEGRFRFLDGLHSRK